MPTFDFIVIGAGAAGLSAAATLSQQGRTVCIVEARDRIGGRIFTRYEPDVTVPIELGAEFVHGRQPITMSWLQRANTTMIDTSDNRWTLQAGKLQQSDRLFTTMKRGLEKIPHPKKDLPFSEYLASSANLSTAIREYACALVEGFDAADATRVSTLHTLKSWSGAAAADAPTFRPMHGYAAMIRSMVATLNPQSTQLYLDTAVHAVEWKPGKVTVHATQLGKAITITASQAIMTLPLGVLQRSPQESNAVQFLPELTEKRIALASLASGAAIKVVLRFRHAFWETMHKGRYYDAAFFHAPKAPFRTFWSSLPMRAPLLIAWAGGTKALRLSEYSENDIVEYALRSLELMFGPRTSLRNDFQNAYFHNWQTDPYAYGAYSYVIAGGSRGHKALAEPLKNTLFFAGEASNVEGESATVAGALQSGAQAAALALQSK